MVTGSLVGRRADIDPAEMGDRLGALLNTLVVPRPIAWVSTRSREGVDNLAPHSYFTVASIHPPIVQFTSLGQKDTLRNVRETGEFVVSVATAELASAVNATATEYLPGESEFDAVGLAREPSVVVRPPRVAASPVAIECRAAGEVAFPAATVVFGEVVRIAIAPWVLRDGLVAPDLLDPVARLGRADWARLGEVFALRRIPYGELATPGPDGAG